MKTTTITGQQFLLLKSVLNGRKPVTAAYKFLAGRINYIPNVDTISDMDAVLYLFNNSVLFTNVHSVINRYDEYKRDYNRNRYENRKRLRAAGIIG